MNIVQMPIWALHRPENSTRGIGCEHYLEAGMGLVRALKIAGCIDYEHHPDAIYRPWQSHAASIPITFGLLYGLCTGSRKCV